MTEPVCSGSRQGRKSLGGRASWRRAALKLGLEEVGDGRDMSRRWEEHCPGEEGGPGCTRGLGSALAVQGAGPA